MLTRRGSLLSVAVFLVLLVLSVPAVVAQPKSGGTLRIAASSIQQLDPYKTAANDEINAFSLAYDPLFILSKDDFKPIPHLAESWENPDDKTWVFHLRKGVLFHDGNAVFPKGTKREVTAEDVVYSIERFRKVSTAFVIGDIASVKALDRYTVEIKTSRPEPFLVNDPNRLARVVVMAREAVEKLGEDGVAKTPIGTGPFKLRSFTPDQGLVFEKNPNYWLPVYLDRVEFVVIPDPTVQTMALSAGEVDVVPYLFNVDAVTTLSKDANLRLYSRGGSYRGLGFNVKTAPFDEWEVRDAIAKMLDVDSAVKAVVGKFGERAYGQCPPWVTFGYDPSLKSLWPYDPKAGLAQLAKAGFKDTNGDGILDRGGRPLKVEIKTIAGSQVRVLTILATQLKQLGIDASILQQDTAVWVDDLLQGNTGVFFDFSYAGTTGLHSLFHSSMIGKSNTHFYSNSVVDSLLDQALGTTDGKKLASLWKQAQRKIMEDRAAIPLYFEWGYSVCNKNVNDWVPPWGGLHLVSTENNVWLSK
ncbi:MAG: ABC transporter substrate-binding protein [Firmicutes bacterium]|jgi:peptide/nickel transport system substrate-binding protein|nr:ABC transporter substrate-binding protein [Bacillota bacterium]MDH7496702.1 ABC transporter substrate-binding protein [Bacillota bacterium]